MYAMWPGVASTRGVVFVVKIIRQIGDRAVPTLAGESALSAAGIAFRTRARITNGEFGWRRGRDSSGGQDFFQFSRADHRINFGNIFADLVAESFDQASGDHQFLALSRRSCAQPFPGWCSRIPAARCQ